MQRELLECSQMSKQTTHQYLHNQHGQLLEEHDVLPSEQIENNASEFNENNKRKSCDNNRYIV